MPINTAPYADGIGGILIVPRANQSPALIPFCAIKEYSEEVIVFQKMCSTNDKALGVIRFSKKSDNGKIARRLCDQFVKLAKDKMANQINTSLGEKAPEPIPPKKVTATFNGLSNVMEAIVNTLASIEKVSKVHDIDGEKWFYVDTKRDSDATTTRTFVKYDEKGEITHQFLTKILNLGDVDE